MEKEFSTFMDGGDCNECDNYEREEKRLKKRIKELESSAMIETNYPQIFFAIKWMCENINTEKVEPDDLAGIKDLADQCHVLYLKESL